MYVQICAKYFMELKNDFNVCLGEETYGFVSDYGK